MARSAKACVNTLLLSAFFFTSNVLAATCYENSPNLESSSDAYYDLEESKTFSIDERNQINDLFRNLAGKWKGSATYTECAGPDDAPRIKTSSAVVKATIKPNSDGALNINTEIRHAEKRITKIENLMLLGNSPVFSFEFIDKNHLIFSEKFRRANIKKITKSKSSSNTETIINKAKADTNANIETTYQVTNATKNKTSRLVETIYELELSGSTFSLSKSFYMNGVYVGEELWSLLPR